MKNTNKFYIFLLLLFFSSTLFANWKSLRENLDHRYVVGQFRIYYTLSGSDALKDQSDVNGNNIPDIIENSAIQLTLAQTILENYFNIKNPLTNSRYKDEVKYIDIHYIDMKISGESGDGVITYNYKSFKEIPSPSLSIAVSNKLKSDNLTLAHELFHAYQNGYTYFKTRWYTEGTARWFEYAFKSGTGEEKLLPKTIVELDELLNKTYDAKFFWNRITHLCNKNSKDFDKNNELRKIKYIGSNAPVIEDADIYGYQFISKLFINLSKADKIAAEDRGIKDSKWPESEQQSFKNSPYILKVITETIDEIGCSNKEVLAFKALALEYIKLYNEKKESIDNTKSIKEVGDPFAPYYGNDDALYARNPWNMQLFNKKIYIGAGNTYNIGPAANLGSVPIISLDTINDTFSYEGKVDDEQIDKFCIFNNILYIPGLDAIESHAFGNFYFLNNGKWIKKRTIPNAYHVFSMEFFDGKLFAGISSKKGAEVAWSMDNGDNWTTQQIGYKQSSYALLNVKNRLFVIKQYLPSRTQKKLDEKDLENYSIVSEFKNGSFVPRKDISIDILFPNTELNFNKFIKVTNYRTIRDSAVIIAGYNHKEPFGVYLISSLDSKSVSSKKIELDPKFKPKNILVRGDEFYILGYQQEGKIFSNYVIKVSLDNIKSPKIIMKFDYPAFARSFEESNGYFYFGIGSDIKDPKKWKQKEIHPSTGKILKVKIN